MNRKEYHEMLIERATDDYSESTYKELSPEHWLVHRSQSGMFSSHVSIMGSCIAVWGDIEGCFFAYAPSSYDAVAKIHWLANSSLDYVAQKARIGMGNVGCSNFNQDVARDDLDTEIEDCENNELMRELKLIRDIHYGSSEREIREAIYEHTDDAELAFEVGRIISARVVYAWAAVHRLSELLKEGE